MATPVRRSAATIIWTNPGGERCLLSPMSGGKGLLEIELLGDQVAVHSRNCGLLEGDEFTELSEFEFTLSLQRCQINWSCHERIEDGDVERSAYFAQ